MVTGFWFRSLRAEKDIKGGWTKALENHAAGRRKWSDRGSAIINMMGLKARNSWGREGRSKWRLTRMKLVDKTITWDGLKPEEFCSQQLTAASLSFGKAVGKIYDC